MSPTGDSIGRTVQIDEAAVIGLVDEAAILVFQGVIERDHLVDINLQKRSLGMEDWTNSLAAYGESCPRARRG